MGVWTRKKFVRFLKMNGIVGRVYASRLVHVSRSRGCLCCGEGGREGTSASNHKFLDRVVMLRQLLSTFFVTVTELDHPAI